MTDSRSRVKFTKIESGIIVRLPKLSIDSTFPYILIPSFSSGNLRCTS